MATPLTLGARLRYPITVSKLLKNKGDSVAKQETILQYTYKYERTVGDADMGEERTEVETGIADWDCPVEGTLKSWLLKVGDVIHRDQTLATVEESCRHDIQYAGLCVYCGKDMSEASWASDRLDTERAQVEMVHDNVALKVSKDQALIAEMDLQKRLLTDRKLSLVVDLDQTIIHACIEPTVGEWQSDPSNPNHASVKDVRKFQLDDGPRVGGNGCWYYIKMRPGLTEFLEHIATLFELHVYTMGTRAYALNIAKLVDPTQKLFGNRVISRDENGSMTEKRLNRLFPVSTNMVVVIDDRADVWPQNRANLIKVVPYDFFKGIGDINSSFLPKVVDIAPAAPAEKPATEQLPSPPDSTPPSNPPSLADQEAIVANGGDQNAILQLQAEEQERTLEKQLKDRPLLHLQEKLDKEDEEAEKTATDGGDNAEPATNGHSEAHHRHNLLRDDDNELHYLEQHLTTLHHSFYEQYDARSANRRPHDIAPDVVPDVGATLSFLKSQVLKGTRIVLSGLVPIGSDIRKTEIGLQAESFGTEIHTRVTSDITHLVISSSRPRTQKVRHAARIPTIKIVNQNWLLDSLSQWEHVDETPYLIEVDPADRNATTPHGDGQGKSASPPARPRITVSTSGQQLFEDEHGEDGGDEGAEDDSGGEDDYPDGEDGDDEVHDRYNVLPADLGDGAHSPVDDLKEMEWGDVDKELEEFMGSDVEDSEDGNSTDRGGDTDNEEALQGTKRKYGEGLSTGEEDGSSSSMLAKKQKLAKSRMTGLRNVKNAGEEDDEEAEGGDGLPTPTITGDEGQGNAAEGDDDDDFDLEAELEAELEAMSDDDGGGEGS